MCSKIQTKTLKLYVCQFNKILFSSPKTFAVPILILNFLTKALTALKTQSSLPNQTHYTHLHSSPHHLLPTSSKPTDVKNLKRTFQSTLCTKLPPSHHFTVAPKPKALSASTPSVLQLVFQ